MSRYWISAFVCDISACIQYSLIFHYPELLKHILAKEVIGFTLETVDNQTPMVSYWVDADSALVFAFIGLLKVVHKCHFPGYDSGVTLVPLGQRTKVDVQNNTYVTIFFKNNGYTVSTAWCIG